MRILLAPALLTDTEQRTFMEGVASVLSKADIITAVSCEEKGLPGCTWYPAPVPKKPLLSSAGDCRSYEEYMYVQGVMSQPYLQADVKALEEAIDDFKPELIIALHRPAALLVSQLHEIPCWVLVHGAMYRNLYFPSQSMYGFNQTASSLKLEQELSLSSFYAKARRRIGFGSEIFSPFLIKENVSRLGFMCEIPEHAPRGNRFIICSDHILNSPHRFRKIIEAAFLGASYRVDIYGIGMENDINDNLHFHEGMDMSAIPKAAAVIHSGSSYMTSLCLAYGIPQIIIADHSCFRSFNALALERVKAGICLFEENLTMASLYETYRTLLADDGYALHAKETQKTFSRHGSIKEIVDLLYIDLINAK